MIERLDVGITFAFYGSFTSKPIKAKVESVLTFLTRKTHTYIVNGKSFDPTVVRLYDEKK